ncbi:MAG: NAD dependent epimerase/dehydratase family enzyme [Sediminicola sp.]|jgi:NAD dependent epimerase/dehydratase family enzyme
MPTILIIGGTGFIGRIIHKMPSKRDLQLKILIGTRQKDTNEPLSIFPGWRLKVTK